MSGQKPDESGDDCNRNDGRYKDTGNTVCDLGDWSLGGSRIAYHFDDLGEGGILAYTRCLTFDKTRLIDGSSRNKITGRFVNRNALTGKGRFIDRTVSFNDHTVDRDAFSGTYHKEVSLVYLLDRDGGLLTISKNDGSFGGKLHETLKCIGGSALGTCFKHFADSDEGQDHGCRFKVKFHHIIHDSCRITVHLCSCHGKECIDTPYKGCHRAECDQRVHIRGTVPQTLKSADKKFLVDDHDDPGKQHLDKSHGNMVVIEPRRERPAPHHMSHGKVHKYQQKSDGSNQAASENRCLMIRKSLLCFRHGNLFFAGSLKRCTVASLFYRLDNVMGGGISLNSHGVCQKTDGAGCDSRHPGYSLLHPGTAGSTAHPGDVVLFHYKFLL